jgi:hypothetical protein
MVLLTMLWDKVLVYVKFYIDGMGYQFNGQGVYVTNTQLTHTTACAMGTCLVKNSAGQVATIPIGLNY